MQIFHVPFTVTDWEAVPKTEVKGESGTSFWQVVEAGNVRARIVEYSPGYRADHWCARGHVLIVLSGEFHIELKDGRSFRLKPGMGFQTGDDEGNPHLGFSLAGAKVFLVD
jgi:hypothetical protein